MQSAPGTSAATALTVQGSASGVPVPVSVPSGASLPVTPVGLTRTRLTCTLPAYAAGGNIVCTNEAGGQTTTACAANTACLVAAANASRRIVEGQSRTAGATIDIGYSASVAPDRQRLRRPGLGGRAGWRLHREPRPCRPVLCRHTHGRRVLVFVQGQ